MSTEIDGVNGIIKNTTSDGDITIKGNDGGSEISALTLDMSDAGTATFNHDIALGDDSIAKFGDSGELHIYHHNNGTSFIQETGSGNLELLASNFKVMNAANTENKIAATTDGSVDLYHNNIKKFLTSSTGINLPVDGDSIKFGANSEVVLTHVHDSGLKITHDGGGDPDLILANTASASDGNQLGSVFFNGQNSNGDEHTYAFMLAQARDVTDGEEDGQLVFYGNKGGSDKQFITYGANANGASPTHEVCINEGSEDIDFRVESNGKTHALFVDGGNDVVGIINSTPNSFETGYNDLVVGDTDTHHGLTIVGGTSHQSSIAFADGTSGNAAYRGSIFYNHASDAMVFTTSATQVASFHTDGIVFNENSNDQNFRIESNDNTHMIFVDGGNNHVSINEFDGGGEFNVKSVSQTGVVVESNSASVGQYIGKNNSASNDTQIMILQSARNSTAHFEFGRFKSNDGSDLEMLFDGAGAIKIDGVVTTGGIDYAEYFEWKDGNSSSEDRRGHSVITDGNKIVVATSSDDASKIIGIVSTNPTVLGDADLERWMFKYERDDYGSLVWEEHTVTEWTDEDGKDHSYDTDRIPSDVTAPSDATVISEEKDRYGNTIKLKRKKLNSSWDSSKDYISREDRKEWEAIGLVGKLRLKKGEPVNPNWIKLRDISDTVEEWLVR